MEFIKQYIIPLIKALGGAIWRGLLLLLRRLYNLALLHRNNRVVHYVLIAAVISVITIFKCGNNSTSSHFKEKKRERSINSLINNEMSELEHTKTFDREIESFMRRWELTGGTFALMRNDSLLYAKGYGYANKELGVKCDVESLFRIASVSKLITATAIMKLIEDGKLSLSTQVFGAEGLLCDTMFLDLQSRNLEKITVEHLLRHTAGFSTPINDPAFANYSVAKYLDKELPLTVDDMVLYATKNKLRYQPGGAYDYSNLGYIVLGKVIEVVSGQSYESYTQKHILAPAGCYDMYIGKNFSEDRDPNEVSYYEVKEAEPVIAYDGSNRRVMKSNGGNNITLLGAAGGWVASSVELLRFVAAINGYSGKSDILTKESIETMTYDSSNRQKKPIGWATVRGNEWLRSGSMAGTNAYIKKQKDGYTWIFITNSSAWIGYHLSTYLSRHIDKAMSKVKEWPKRDLFESQSKPLAE